MKASVSSSQLLPQASGRIVYLDLLRIVACLAVIMCHVSADNWYDTDPASFNWQVLNAYDSFVCFCVPVFFMISGTFFLNPNKELPLKALYKKYILRIAVAYLFWSLAYAVYGYLTLGEALSPSDAALTILNSTLESHGHLWFLPVLIGLYIITPLLRQISAKPETEKYFLILFFIFGIGLSTLMVFDIPYTWALQTAVVMEMATGYAGYFVLGRYLHVHEFSKRFRAAAYVLGALGIVACVAVSVVYSLQLGEPSAKLYGYLSITSLFSAVGFFLFFKYHAPKWRWTAKAQRFIQGLSACTFGAYLIHPLFLSVLYDAGIHSLTFNPAAAVPMLTLGVFIVSAAVSWLIRRIPVIHKFIT